MGLIFNGSSDNITASDGNLTITGLDIEGSQNINTTGIITASSVKVTGALTYEDVTNVDSIGIITARDHINISTDNKRLKFGAGDDLNLYSTGTNGWVYTPQSGADLYMGTNAGEVYIQTGSSGNDTAIKVNSGGAVELYHANAKKLETASWGTQIHGVLATTSHVDINSDSGQLKLGASADLKIYHNGSASYIVDSGPGDLILRASDQLKIQETDNGENMAIFNKDGSVDLYHNNVKKFETTADGIQVTGKIFPSSHIDMADNVKLLIGTGDDIEVFHDGNHSYIDNHTGNLKIRNAAAGNILIQARDDDEGIIVKPDGAVELYHDNNKKIETTSGGAAVSTTNNGFSIGQVGHTGGNVRLDIHSATSGVGSLIRFLNDHHDAAYIGLAGDTTGNFIMHGGASKIEIKPNGSAAVELFHGTSKRFETTAGGTIVTGTIDTTGTIACGGHIKTGTDTGKFFAGASNDLQIYHNGSHSYIDDAGTGNLYIRGTQIVLQSADGSEDLAIFSTNGQAKLYYDNSKKLETNSTGIHIFGNTGHADGAADLYGSGNDFSIYHDGTNSIQFFDSQVGAVKFRTDIGNSARNNIVLGQGVDLYHLNSKKLETGSHGISVTGYISCSGSSYGYTGGDNVKLSLGNNNDLQVWHDGSNSIIKDNGTGSLLLYGDAINLGSASGEYYIRAFENGAVYLRYDNTTKLETTSNGVTITGDLTVTGSAPGGTSTGELYVYAKNGSGSASNTGENIHAGYRSGSALASGAAENCFYGWEAGRYVSTGDQNAFFGAQAGENTSTSSQNTAMGSEALRSNQTGASNTAVGKSALRANTASNNVAIGHDAMLTNTSGSGNIAIGKLAFRSNSSGQENTIVGHQAAQANTSNRNTCLGNNALYSNTSGYDNVVIGRYAMMLSNSGNSLATQGCTVIGTNAMYTGGGDGNIAIGSGAAYNYTSAHNNTVIGGAAFDAATTSTYTVVIGNNCLGAYNSGACESVAIGSQCAASLTSGNENVFIGRECANGITGGSYNIFIGKGALGSSTHSNVHSNVVVGKGAALSLIHI